LEKNKHISVVIKTTQDLSHLGDVCHSLLTPEGED